MRRMAKIGGLRAWPGRAVREESDLRRNGMIRSFETMTARAVVATRMVEVAADMLPTSARAWTSGFFARTGRARIVKSRSIPPLGKAMRPATASGMTNRLKATR